MISIDFLRKPVAGLEFMSFQSDTLFKELQAVLAPHVAVDSGKHVLSKDCEKDLLRVMATHTGFTNITLVLETVGNLYADVGYLSPNNVLNNPLADLYASSTHTTLYRWFEEKKEKIFKGAVDYSTGRVSGSFSTLPIKIGINVNIEQYFDPKLTAKWGGTVVDALAGAVVHELGHAFSACMMMSTSVKDNLIAMAGLEHYRKATREEDRVVVLRDSAQLLEMKPAAVDELKVYATNGNEEQYMLFFNKLVSQRNTQRALSLGVSAMTSEVVADAYAIRMGCGRGIVAAIGSLVDRGVIRIVTDSFLAGLVGAMQSITMAVPLVIIAGAPAMLILGVVGAGFLIGSVLGYFMPEYSGVYNAGNRRMEDAIRQFIAKLKTLRDVPNKERTELVEYLVKLLDDLKGLRPWYDNTVIQRSLGWLFSGNDASRKEVEHHTQALNNHELHVLAEQVKQIS